MFILDIFATILSGSTLLVSRIAVVLVSAFDRLVPSVAGQI
jgi:hypothetical protein